MKSKISEIISKGTTCLACEPRKMRKEQQSMAVPFSQFMVDSVDNIGPIPTSTEQYIYIFTWVDGFSRVCAARPLRDVSSVSICNALKNIMEEKGHICGISVIAPFVRDTVLKERC